MKVLFVGLGSAGQRHLRNLKRLLGNDVELMAYRVRRLSRVLEDELWQKRTRYRNLMTCRKHWLRSRISWLFRIPTVCI